MPRQHVLLTLALTLLSLGLYLPIWYLRRRPALEALGTGTRLNLSVLRLVLAVYVVDFSLSLLSMLMPGLEQSLSVLDPYAFWSDLSCSILLLWQSFRVKRILQQAWGVQLNPLYTLFFYAPVSTKLDESSQWAAAAGSGRQRNEGQAPVTSRHSQRDLGKCARMQHQKIFGKGRF